MGNTTIGGLIGLFSRYMIKYQVVNNHIAGSNSSCLFLCLATYTGVHPNLHWGASQLTVWSLLTYSEVSQIYTRVPPSLYWWSYTAVPLNLQWGSFQLMLQCLPTYTGVHPNLHKGTYQVILGCLSTYTGVPPQPTQGWFPSALTPPRHLLPSKFSN